MSFDVSRISFDPLKDYFGVVMQQGRVQTDADWNELVAQIRRRIQAETLDTVGSSGVPFETPDGFAISLQGNDLNIGPGRMYVDGILVENHTQAIKWDARLEENSGTGKLSGIDLPSAPSGLQGVATYSQQPHLVLPPALPNGSYLVYLDVWYRDVDRLLDPSLEDVALGVDTTTRNQVVWQVKTLPVPAGTDPATPDVDIPDWLKTVHPSSARMSAIKGEAPPADDPCELPPGAGYKGLENHLFRVQIHDGGGADAATFKWSRDNAMVSQRVMAMPTAKSIRLDSLGLDEYRGFKGGDWVEITDDYRIHHGLPGEMRRIKLVDGVEPVTRTITLVGDPLPLGNGPGQFPVDNEDKTLPERHTRVIRWDQKEKVLDDQHAEIFDLDIIANGGVIPVNAAQKIAIEKGVVVEFSLESLVDEADGFAPEFKSGDYWTIVARVQDLSVQEYTNAPPRGIHHHFAKLAFVDNGEVFDSRDFFPHGHAGCGCTVCVDVEDHNQGRVTIQRAVDYVTAQGGGTVCLGAGEYRLSRPISINGETVTLRGQGWKTIVQAAGPTSLVDIQDSVDVTLERMLLLSTASQKRGASINVNNVVGCRVRECFISNFAFERSDSVGIQLRGLCAITAIEDNFFQASHGISGPGNREEFLTTLGLNIRNNYLNCSQVGVGFGSVSVHLDQLNIVDNTIKGADTVGIELSGTVAPDAAVALSNNELQNCSNGIRLGVGNVRLSANDLTVRREASATAIAIVPGFTDEPLSDLQIIGNRMRGYAQHAMSVETHVDNIMVKQNQLKDIGGAAFIVEETGFIDTLSFENNQIENIAGELGREQFVAAMHLQVGRADISDNTFRELVHVNQAANVRAGLSVVAFAELRVQSNRFLGLTPSAYRGFGAGIWINSNSGHAEISGNTISRRERTGAVETASWVPVITVPQRIFGLGRLFAPVVDNGGDAVLVTRNNIFRLSANRHAIDMRNNKLDGATSTAACIIVFADDCRLSDNEITHDRAVLLAQVRSDLATINNNRFATNDDRDVLHITARQFVVMGNISTGNIRVRDGSNVQPLPQPWAPLNPIG